MSSHAFAYQQSDLSRLCADRSLQTAEMHATNDFYGQASLLKRYARLPAWYSLKGVVEHGVNLDDQMWSVDREANVPVIFSPSAWRAQVHRQLSGKPAVPIGFGYLYAKRLVESAWPTAAEPRGTVVFPCHSTHTISVSFNHDAFARELAALPPRFHPITACIYWKNYLEGEHHPYADQGMDVVTAGHIFDHDFMLRMHDICRRFRYATSNAVGTHVFMAVSSGCRFFYTDSSPLQWRVPDCEKASSAIGNELFEKRHRHSRSLFAKPVEEVTADQSRFVADLMGDAHVREPHVLARLLLRAELADKTGWRPDGAWSNPAFLQRRLARLQRLKRSVAKRLPWTRRPAA
ncbi:MAG: hypothetical protein QGG36_32395 [Pirellulaceae bacterium]|nr:hypothetical protein [Pirellulaceae bacterium]MDP7020545.1 hypothetical protein [Pirellulaceae bacterium]